MAEKILLYHGTNVIVRNPEVRVAFKEYYKL